MDIVLAAYNGEAFIGEQLDSLLGQTETNWRLLIRDDGSRDRTVSIVREYLKREPHRLVLIEDDLGNLGPTQCFSRLLQRTEADHVMFCDQDDIWLPEKVATQLGDIREIETAQGRGTPIAVFSDARVIDGERHVLADSLLAYINRDGHEGQDLRRLAVEGTTYGCTMILNRALVQAIGGMPAATISHDWWSALVAASTGRLVYSPRRLLLHRRHRANVSATRQNSWRRYLRHSTTLARHHEWLQRVLAQAEALHVNYGPRLAGEPRRLLDDLAGARHSNWLKRRWVLARSGVRTTGFARNVAFFLAL